jgi:hypothetical protein
MGPNHLGPQFRQAAERAIGDKDGAVIVMPWPEAVRSQPLSGAS